MVKIWKKGGGLKSNNSRNKIIKNSYYLCDICLFLKYFQKILLFSHPLPGIRVKWVRKVWVMKSGHFFKRVKKLNKPPDCSFVVKGEAPVVRKSLGCLSDCWDWVSCSSNK